MNTLLRKLFLSLACLWILSAARAQTDSSQKAASSPDTLRIGNMTIVRSGDAATGDGTVLHVHSYHHPYHSSNFSTNWVIVDLGFTNYNDRTDYTSGATQQFAPGSNADWFSLRNNKSVDVNIWFFMQRMNLIQHVVNLKYGLGLELNNYRYSRNIKYLTAPTTVIMDTIHYVKNKLAADYVTVPFMLNFNFTPSRRDGFGISVGASVGYLYNARQKLISGEYGKHKTYDNFDLNPWKVSWIAELQLGPVKLYGSYATQSMFKKGLNQVPYTVGLRLSNW